MNNLGSYIQKMNELEKEAITLRFATLNGNTTFNCEILDFEFLKRLHKYLFCDVYEDELTNTRNMDNKEKKRMNRMLLRVNEICKNNPENIKEIIDLLHNLWDLQPFMDGNTRTLIGYLAVLKEYYNLDIAFDIHDDIRDVIRYKKLELIKK